MQDDQFREQMLRLINNYKKSDGTLPRVGKLSDEMKWEYHHSLSAIQYQLFTTTITNIIRTRYTFPSIAHIHEEATRQAVAQVKIGNPVVQFGILWEGVEWFNSEEQTKKRKFQDTFNRKYDDWDSLPTHTQSILMEMGGYESIFIDEKPYFRKEFERLWQIRVEAIAERDYLYDRNDE